MKYIEQSRIGDPAEVLDLRQIETPRPGPGEARARVLATPIHPSNLLKIAGRYGEQPDLPETPGTEGVGEIVELGSDVTQLKVGQRVLLAGRGGTWRDEMVAPASAFVPLPGAGDAEQLSMLAINPLTAFRMLKDFVDLEEGDWVVQSAANSAVGEYLIQLAAAWGIRTVNVVRREDQVEPLRTLGADAVVVDGPDLAGRIRSAAGGAAIRLAVDCVGGDTMTALLDSLGHGGTLVSYGALSGKPGAMDPAKMIFSELRVRGFWLAKWYETASADDKLAAFGEIVPLIAGGKLAATIDARYPLEQIREAVSRAAQEGRNGKVLLVPGADRVPQ